MDSVSVLQIRFGRQFEQELRQAEDRRQVIQAGQQQEKVRGRKGGQVTRKDLNLKAGKLGQAGGTRTGQK